MDTSTAVRFDVPSNLPDTREVPLTRLHPASKALRRIVPTENSQRVPVAAFNASL
jgi:FXSXX-COOH protein